MSLTDLRSNSERIILVFKSFQSKYNLFDSLMTFNDRHQDHMLNWPTPLCSKHENNHRTCVTWYSWAQYLCLSNQGLCSTHESWVKFDSTLTQMSRVRVESRWSSFESELSQLDTAWVKVESIIFQGENVKILQWSVTLQRKNQPTATFDRRFDSTLTQMSWVRVESD